LGITALAKHIRKREKKLPASGMTEVTSLQTQQLLKGEGGDNKG